LNFFLSQFRIFYTTEKTKSKVIFGDPENLYLFFFENLAEEEWEEKDLELLEELGWEREKLPEEREEKFEWLGREIVVRGEEKDLGEIEGELLEKLLTRGA